MILIVRKYKISSRLSKIIAIFLGIVILILTFLRENVFLEINAIIDGYDYNNAYFYFLNKSISMLSSFQLITLKWVLTIFFILVIAGLSFLTIKLWFNNKKYNQITIFIYLIFFGLTGLITLLFWLTGYYVDYYFVIRKMIGFLQSPIPLFLFFSMYIYLIKDKVKNIN